MKGLVLMTPYFIEANSNRTGHMIIAKAFLTAMGFTWTLAAGGPRAAPGAERGRQ